MLAVVSLIGVFLAGDAQAAFFSRAKGGGGGKSSKETASAPAKGSEQKRGGVLSSERVRESALASSAAPRGSFFRGYVRDSAPATASTGQGYYYSREPRGSSRPASVHTPPANDPVISVSKEHGGFFGESKNRPGFSASAPVSPRDTDSAPALYSGRQGGFFGESKNRPGFSASAPVSPRDTDSAPALYSGRQGGFFGESKSGPRNTVGGAISLRAGGAQGAFSSGPHARTFTPDRAMFTSVVRTAPRSGWTSRGYFELLHEQLKARHRGGYVAFYWYYPYDYCYYRWRHFHVLPLFVCVDDFYFGAWYPWDGWQFYYAAPPTIVVVEPRDWVEGETYLPYATWPSSDLMEAKGDLEQAWRQSRIDLIDRHLDPDHEIASYLRDEHTHDLTASEFRQLTLDAFNSIRTRNFDITSVRYVSNSDWARLNGKHVFYDPNDKCLTVYLSYLLHRVEDDHGRWRWVIWEVRQSPRPD
jgi:hypothetical protein